MCIEYIYMKTNNNVKEYLETLNDLEKYAMQIAIKQLGSSFDIEKSNGYIVWLKSLK